MGIINIANSTITTQYFSIWDTGSRLTSASDFGAYVTMTDFEPSLPAMVYMSCSSNFILKRLTINAHITKFLGSVYEDDFISDGHHHIINFLDEE